MLLFIYFLLIVGLVAGYFFGVDAALLAGKKAIQLWILVWLLLFLIRPIVDLYRRIREIIARLKTRT